MNVEMVLIEKPIECGMHLEDVISLLGKIKHEEFIPIEIDNLNGNSSAMGFITIGFADALGYDYEGSGLNTFISSILADIGNEVSNGTYEFKGYSIYLTR